MVIFTMGWHGEIKIKKHIWVHIFYCSETAYDTERKLFFFRLVGGPLEKYRELFYFFLFDTRVM